MAVGAELPLDLLAVEGVFAGRVVVAAGGKSAACKRVSFQSAGTGQPTPAVSARFRYSCTVLTDIEQLRAIWR
jgi:hypothetical protein